MCVITLYITSIKIMFKQITRVELKLTNVLQNILHNKSVFLAEFDKQSDKLLFLSHDLVDDVFAGNKCIN